MATAQLSKGIGPRRGAIALFLVVASLGPLALTAGASSAEGSITIGQLAPGSSPTGFADPSGMMDIAQPTVTSGNTYVVPGTGTITSWSHNAAAGSGQVMTFKVFRPLTVFTYLAVGHDGPRLLTGGAVNTFPSNIPVKRGDVIGLFFSVAPPGKASIFVVPGESYRFREGVLADGQSGTFTASDDRRVNATAVFEPSNTFTLGATARNKKQGTATLDFTLPNPGDLTASGTGVGAASAGHAVISKSVDAGTAQLLVKAKGKKKRKLNETGKVKVNLAVTYTPTGGDPSTQSVKVKLKKK